MGTLSKLRRMVLRDGLSIREASRKLSISRTTAAKWLAQDQMIEPRYTRREPAASILDPYKDQLALWLKADSHRGKRDRRGIKAMFESIQSMGYRGSRGPVYTWCQRWLQEQAGKPRNAGFVPLSFELGEAFQFDWSCEYALIGGIRWRLEVAHIKLAASRAFLLVAYHAQAHEMLFDAHARAFAAFGGVPKRGIYDNMKTVVDRIGTGKQRSVNARFETMTGHYLFEAEFCNRAAGWEKGIVEKNVQDRRRGVWREVGEKRWSTLEELNDWLHGACLAGWAEARHPEWPELSVADLWQDERTRLMPCPQPFDGYVEQPLRVSSTSLIHFQRNRYSVPCEWVNAVVSLRAYHDHLLVVGPEGELVRLARSFEREQTIYDWTHYIALIERKPGALRNGAPFKTMPSLLQELQRQLLKHPGGDRVMAQVLTGVTLHGLDAVLKAMKQPMRLESVDTPLTLLRPPQANVSQYDSLRAQTSAQEQEAGHDQ